MSSSKPALRGKKKFCFICGLINEDENRRVGLFSVTKTNLPLWKNLIPELKPTSRLCDAHFDEKDIVKGFYNRQDYIPAEKWRLTPSAIPKYFLVRDKATSSKCPRTPSKLQFSENTEHMLKGKRANSSVLTSTLLPGPQSESPIETSNIGKVASSSGVKDNPRKLLKRLVTLDSASSNSLKKNKISCAQTDKSTSREPIAIESNSNKDEMENISMEKPGSPSKSNEHSVGSSESQTNTLGNNVPLQNSFVSTRVSESIVDKAELGTSYHSKSNSPQEVPSLNSTPMQPTLEPTAVTKVPATPKNHSSSPDSTPGPEDVVTTTNTPRQETVKVTDVSSVSLKKPRQKRRFIPLVNCSKCSKEIRGKCSSCLIKELKFIINEKDKEIKELKSKDKIQVKTIARKDNKIISLKDRIKEYRKKLNTSAHRIARMRQCAREIASTLTDLQDDVLN